MYIFQIIEVRSYLPGIHYTLPHSLYVSWTLNLMNDFFGRAGGTAGAVATCPLEVVKTRLQSSLGMSLTAHPAFRLSHNTVLAHTAGIHTSQGAILPVLRSQTGSLRYCLA
jgi:hypothetical protein